MASSLVGGLFFLCACFTFTFVQAKTPNKVAVDVYYESLCPDSKRFFQDQLTPVYEEIQARINLRFIPFGNAHILGEPDNWKFDCQHGAKECLGNIIQTCAVDIMNNTLTSLQFITCAFNYREQSQIIDKCLESSNLQYKIRECSNGPMGANLEYMMGKETQMLQPKQNFIPWIVFDKKGSAAVNEKANEDFLQVLCGMLEDDVPAICQKHKRSLRDIYRRLVGL